MAHYEWVNKMPQSPLEKGEGMLPRNAVLSEVGGRFSIITIVYTAMANSTVTDSDTFSPLVTGSKNVRLPTASSNMHGSI